jgi:uncharacterized membrane protein
VRPFGLLEVSTYGHAWFLMAGVLIAWGARNLDGVFLWGGRLLYALAFLKLVLADVLFLNPYLWHQDVGGLPVLNWLLYVYGVPILILALLARTEGGEGWARVSRPVSLYGGLVLGLVLVTLEVRQCFHRNFLDKEPIVDMENYAYSAAWILFALLLLAVGIAKGIKAPRVASLVVILLAVAKVFIYDLRHLEDLYRVGSFLALGISLLLISFLYQRFVFREVSRD